MTSLLSKVRAFFQAPTFSGDERKTRTAWLLNLMMLLSLGVGLLLLVGWLLFLPGFAPLGWLASAVIAIALFGALLVRLRKLRLASWMYLSLYWLLVTASVLAFGELGFSYYAGYLVLVFLAGFLINRRTAVGLALVSILADLAFSLGRHEVLWPFPGTPLTPLLYWFSRTAWMAAGLIILSLALGILRQALGRADQEVAERRLAEELLRNEEARFRIMVENISEAIMLFDAEGRVLYHSPMAERLLGYSARAIRRGRFQAVFFDPADQLRVQQIYDELMNTPGGIAGGRFRVLHRSGRPIWIEVHASNLLHIPNVQAVVVNFREITEQLQAEKALEEWQQRYELITAAAGQVVFEMDPERKTILWSGSFDQTLSEWKNEIRNGQMSWLEIFAPEERARLQNDLEEAQREGLGFRGEYLCASSQGERILQVQVLPLPAAGEGKQHRILGVMTDITTVYQALRRIQILNLQLEDRVRQRTTELEQKNRELETFAYSVSHDLKAPLRGILGYSGLLLADFAEQLGEEGRYYLGAVQQAAQNMHNLIEDLLTYSRLQRRPYGMMPVSLQSVVNKLLAERQEEINRRQVQVLLDLPFDQLQAEPEGLEQALRNLLDNALKFTTPTERAKIEICGVESPEAFQICVKDNGIGFDMKYHDRIFEIFQRLNRPEEFPGTGIGLALVRMAVERMGGRVWAQSAPGLGAAFYLEIPKKLAGIPAASD